MPESYPFPTYSGLLEPEHYNKIGSAIWLFLWCVSSTTKEVERDGINWGIVLGNKPMKIPELAEIFGVNEKTVRRWLGALEQHEYLKITRAPYGLILSVKNSKKTFKKRVDKNVHSETGEWTKMSDDPAKMSDLSDKNVHSNKDILKDKLKDIKEVVVDTHEEKKDPPKKYDNVDRIAEYYMVIRGKPGQAPKVSDYQCISAVLSAGVEVEEVLRGVDQAFADYKPRYPGDEISSFGYCKKVILANFYSNRAREEANHEQAKILRYPGSSGRSQTKKRESVTGGQVGRIGRRKPEA
ncbi:hypothetical protein [Fictibacillus sp. 18YEL24]|uniref:hypothetical protein n=1 Tax=Fictibacillus sp. 18YEL24 TaxID=2745875 RepID=UPI0018CF038B|nr:hypothetical protein [Fictibacillus sp. 18YEL24]MBH0171049.1 hypothetical protein [Fictibacillus sp. 18YEL24]